MVSERIKKMKPSATLAQSSKIAELREQGIHIIGFNVGEPDFDTPVAIVEKGKEALQKGLTRYTPGPGMIALRQEICRKFKREYQLEYDYQDVVVSSGAKQALTNALMALVNPGDEVIIPTPCWVSYIEMVKLADGVPILVKTKEENGFALDMEAIKKAVTHKTKAIMINSPNNPTGAVYTEEHLKQLGELAVKEDFYIISDEVYERLVYDRVKNCCVGALSPAIREKTITINGVSKAYAMTGWRIGYAVGPRAIIKAMGDYQGHTTTSPNTPAQYAAIEAIANGDQKAEMMRQAFDERRVYLVNRLKQMAGIQCNMPKGAFYVMPNITAYFGKSTNKRMIQTTTDLADYLLEEAHIAVVAGEAFEAPSHLRISYSNSMENIQEGMDRMEQALRRLK